MTVVVVGAGVEPVSEVADMTLSLKRHHRDAPCSAMCEENKLGRANTRDFR